MHSDLPKAAQKSAQFSVRETLSRHKHFGIVLNRMNTTQLSFMMINNINAYLDQHTDTDIHIYSNQNEVPIVVPLTGLFSTLEMMHSSGPLIACDIQSVFKLPISSEAQYYYYVYDPLLLNYIKPEEIQFLQKLNIKLIVRNKAHAEILKMLDLPIIKKYVPDCNIEILKEIVT